MKRCGKCCIEKDETEFHKSSRRADGLGNRCKLCKSIEHKEYVLKYPEKQKEKYLIKLPEWRAANKQKCKEYARRDRERKALNLTKKAMTLEEMTFLKEKAKQNQIEWLALSDERKKLWRKEYRQRDSIKYKNKARHILQDAVLGKKIRRPNKCEMCNVECVPEGHHIDYSKPLFVQWVCNLCHNILHRKRLDARSDE